MMQMKPHRPLLLSAAVLLILISVLLLFAHSGPLLIRDAQFFTTLHGQTVCQIETNRYRALVAEPKDSQVLVVWQGKGPFAWVFQTLVPLSALSGEEDLWRAAFHYALFDSQPSEVEAFCLP